MFCHIWSTSSECHAGSLWEIIDVGKISLSIVGIEVPKQALMMHDGRNIVGI